MKNSINKRTENSISPVNFNRNDILKINKNLDPNKAMAII